MLALERLNVLLAPRITPFQGAGSLTVQRGKGLVHRAVPGAQDLDEVGGRAVAEVEVAASHLHLELTIVEMRMQPGFRAPVRGWLRTGWRRQMPAEGLEHLADEAFRCPVGQTDPSAAATDPRQLLGRLRLIRGEHHAEGREHRVVTVICERQRLGVGDDALRRRNGGGYRLAGCWSVQLAPGGYHAPHVHPEGWLSSACYIDLPPAVDAGGHEGWIGFGAPPFACIVPTPSEHFEKPEPGKLVLFPSYMWHGTVPFGGAKPRLTIAFDLVPA